MSETNTLVIKEWPAGKDRTDLFSYIRTNYNSSLQRIVFLPNGSVVVNYRNKESAKKVLESIVKETKIVVQYGEESLVPPPIRPPHAGSEKENSIFISDQNTHLSLVEVAKFMTYYLGFKAAYHFDFKTKTFEELAPQMPLPSHRKFIAKFQFNNTNQAEKAVYDLYSMTNMTVSFSMPRMEPRPQHVSQERKSDSNKNYTEDLRRYIPPIKSKPPQDHRRKRDSDHSARSPEKRYSKIDSSKKEDDHLETASVASSTGSRWSETSAKQNPHRPGRVIYVSDMKSMHKSNVFLAISRCPGFITAHIGDTNIRGVFSNVEFAKMAINQLVENNPHQWTIGFAKKEPPRRKVEEIGEESRVLWTSTLYFKEKDDLEVFLKGLFPDSFLYAKFEEDHSWLHFKDNRGAKNALRTLNGTTNLYSVFSRDRSQKGSSPRKQTTSPQQERQVSLQQGKLTVGLCNRPQESSRISPQKQGSSHVEKHQEPLVTKPSPETVQEVTFDIKDLQFNIGNWGDETGDDTVDDHNLVVQLQQKRESPGASQMKSPTSETEEVVVEEQEYEVSLDSGLDDESGDFDEYRPGASPTTQHSIPHQPTLIESSLTVETTVLDESDDQPIAVVPAQAYDDLLARYNDMHQIHETMIHDIARMLPDFQTMLDQQKEDGLYTKCHQHISRLEKYLNNEHVTRL